jgi:outer membrane immunogenic protein
VWHEARQQWHVPRRDGYAFGATGNWLLYGTGGLAVGDVHGWDSAFSTSGSDLRTGWAAGGGIETSFAPNWTAKVEYLHIDLGRKAIFDSVPDVGVRETVSFKSDLIRFGVNYHFDRY